MKRWLFGGLITTLLVLGMSLAWLSTTQSGLVWLVDKIVPGAQTKTLEGSLFGPLSIEGGQYSSEQISIAFDSLSLSWQPLKLLQGTLLVNEFTISGLRGTSIDSSAESSSAPLNIPIDIEVLKVIVEDAQWNTTVVERASLSGSIHNNVLDLKNLNVNLPDHILNASGVVDISQADSGIMQLEHELLSTIDPKTRVHSRGTISGTWQDLKLQHTFDAPISTTIKATILNATQEDRELQANILIQQLDWPSFGGPENSTIDGHLDFNGAMSKFSLTGQLNSAFRGKNNKLNLSVAANENNLSINKFELATTNINNTAGDTITDKPAIAVELPSLTLKGSVDNYLALMDQMAVAEGPDNDSVKLDVNLQWFDQYWQALFSDSGTSSPSGQVSLLGSLHDFKFNGAAQISTQSDLEKALGAFNFKGRGNTKQLQFESVTMDGALGRLNAAGHLGWQTAIEWKATVKVDELATETFLQEWPGKISGQLTTQGNMETGKPTATVSINGMKGTIKQQPFKADGFISLANQRTNIEKLELSLGTSKLSMSGDIATQSTATRSIAKLNYSLNSPDLALFSTDLAGAVNMTGQIKGSLAAPIVSAVGNATNIRFKDWSAKTVSADINVSTTSQNAPWQGDINVDSIAQNDQIIINTGSVKLSGTADSHSIALVASTAYGVELNSRISARWQNNIWAGNIVDLSLVDSNVFNFNLSQSAAFSLSESSQSLQEMCLIDTAPQSAQTSNEQASICLSFNKRDDQKQNSEINIFAKTQHLSTHVFDEILAVYGLKLDTKIDSEIKLAVPNQNWESAAINGNIIGSSGSITRLGKSSSTDSQEPEKLDFTSFRLDLSAAAVSTFMLQAELSDNTSASANFEIKAPLLSNQFSDALLTGTVKTRIPDLATFSVFYPETMTLNGTLLGNFDVSGSINQTSLAADLTLEKGSIRLTDLGLDLTDLSFKIDAANSASTAISGSAMSGAGRYELSGEVNLDDLSNISGNVRLVGENVLLINSKTVNAEGGLDLALVLAARKAEMTGKITVSKATIGISNQQSVTTESSDVIFSDIVEQKPSVFTSMDILLDLGENTRIDGGGLTGMLRGSPRIRLSEENEITALGKLNLVDGSYLAYGQKLTISKGDVYYAGGAIDDPNLDLEITREVDNNRVGLSLTGRASQPQVNLFSSPSMSDQDVLSMLLFAKPLAEISSIDGLKLLSFANSLRGGQPNSKLDQISDRINNIIGLENVDIKLKADGNQTSLDISSQITSALSIAYGYNFINSIRTLILSYKLSDNWSIQSTIDTESGVDLSYKIERD